MHYTKSQLKKVSEMNFEEFIEYFCKPDSEYSMKQYEHMKGNFINWLLNLTNSESGMLQNIKPCASCNHKLTRYCDWCVYGNARNLYELQENNH